MFHGTALPSQKVLTYLKMFAKKPQISNSKNTRGFFVRNWKKDTIILSPVYPQELLRFLLKQSLLNAQS
jgi:hypothetical protein